MQTRKTRHQFYLPDELSAKLDAMAAQPGSSKTASLTDALTAWFDREIFLYKGRDFEQKLGNIGHVYFDSLPSWRDQWRETPS